MPRLDNPPFKLIDLFNEDGFLFMDSFDKVSEDFSLLYSAPLISRGYDSVNATLTENALSMLFNHGNNGFSRIAMLRTPATWLNGGAGTMFDDRIILTGGYMNIAGGVENDAIAYMDLDDSISVIKVINAMYNGYSWKSTVKYGDYYYFAEYVAGANIERIYKWKDGDTTTTEEVAINEDVWDMVINGNLLYIFAASHPVIYNVTTGVKTDGDAWAGFDFVPGASGLSRFVVIGGNVYAFAGAGGIASVASDGTVTLLSPSASGCYLSLATVVNNKVYAWDYNGGNWVSSWDPNVPAVINTLSVLPADIGAQHAMVYHNGDLYIMSRFDLGAWDAFRMFRYNIATDSVVAIYDGTGIAGTSDMTSDIFVTYPANFRTMFVLNDKIHLIAASVYENRPPYIGGSANLCDNITGAIWQYNGPSSKAYGGGGMSQVRRRIPSVYQDDFWGRTHKFKSIVKFVGGNDALSAQIGFGYLPRSVPCNVASNTGKHVGFKIILDSSNTLPRGIYGSIGDGSTEQLIRLADGINADTKVEFEIDYMPQEKQTTFLINEAEVGSIANMRPIGDASGTNSWLINITARSWGKITSLDLLQLKHYIE